MIGNLGRRLAYLATDGPYAADPLLIRLGQHLMFIARHAFTPGQQLIVSMTDLTREHWVTALSDYEAASLSALDAYVEPPAGTHGFYAANQAEIAPVGPQPEGELDTEVEPLMTGFNDARNSRTEANIVLPLLAPIAAHYEPLVAHTYDLVWRCYERERALPEAPSVARRFTADCDEYIRHIDWTNRSATDAPADTSPGRAQRSGPGGRRSATAGRGGDRRPAANGRLPARRQGPRRRGRARR